MLGDEMMMQIRQMWLLHANLLWWPCVILLCLLQAS